MSKLVEKLKKVRNNGSKKQAHIDLANECIKAVENLERQLEEANGLLKHTPRRVDEMKDFTSPEIGELITNYGDAMYEYIKEQLKEKGDE